LSCLLGLLHVHCGSGDACDAVLTCGGGDGHHGAAPPLITPCWPHGAAPPMNRRHCDFARHCGRVDYALRIGHFRGTVGCPIHKLRRTVLHDIQAELREARLLFTQLLKLDRPDLLHELLLLKELVVALPPLVLAAGAPQAKDDESQYVCAGHTKDGPREEWIVRQVEVLQGCKRLLHGEGVERRREGLEKLLRCRRDQDAAEVGQVKHITVHEAVRHVVWRRGWSDALGAPHSEGVVPVLALELDAAIHPDEIRGARTEAVLALAVTRGRAEVELAAIAGTMDE